MSQEEGDGPSATPFDLLINAIAGSTDYVHPTDIPAAREQSQDSNVDQTLNGTLASASAVQTTNKSARRARRNDSPTPRQKEISKVLSEQIIHQKGNNATTIEIWHPTAGQKSYGKERRILAPPPKLCISGTILPSIASVTLSTTSASATISSSQTHIIAPSSSEPLLSLSGTPDVADVHMEGHNESTIKTRNKKGDKSSHQRKLIYAARNAGFGATLPRSRTNVEGKDRELLLGDGLNFPGLWIGEEVGKNKEFRLELKVDIGPEPSTISTIQEVQPPGAGLGAEDNGAEEVRQHGLREQQEQRQQDEQGSGPFHDIQIDHTTSLSEVLEPSSIEVLQPLAEAVRDANDETAEQTSAEHLPTPQNNTSINSPAVQTVLEDSNQTSSGRDPSNGDARHIIKPVSAPYLTFLSTSLKLVSKPSQKTAKARSMTSCFSINSSFALWTRIHAQTVRTKYMKLECAESEGEGRLTSKTGKWTPFRFEIIKRAFPPPVEKKSKIRNHPEPRIEVEADVGNEDILTYGSIVRLVDLQSGIKSDSVRIVKVESGEHKLNGESDGHPISELQRIGLIRLNTDGSDCLNEDGQRYYLSAPGARLGGGELLDGRSGRARPILNRDKKRPLPVSISSTKDDSSNIPDTLDGLGPQSLPEREVEEGGEPPKKKKKTKRNALAAAVLAEDEDGGSQTVLSWVQAKTNDIPPESDDGVTVRVEKVEDWMSWIIGGVACSSQSIHQTVSASTETLKSINPLPEILVSPTFDPQYNTLDLTLSQFHFPSSAASSRVDEPLEVYLGPIGPLFVTCWRSTSHKNTPTAAIPYQPTEESIDDGEKVVSSFPADKKHVIVRVYLPDIEEIRRVVKDLLAGIKEVDEDECRKNQEGVEGIEPTVQGGLTTVEDDQDQIHSQTQVQDGRPEDESKDADLPDSGFFTNESKLDTTTWFNPEDQSHPADKLDDLSIATALEMTSTLNDLGPFVSSSTSSDSHHVQGTNEGNGMIIDPSLSEGTREHTHTQSESYGALQEQKQRTISNGHDNFGENNTIKLHFAPQSQSDGAVIDKSGSNISLPFVLIRQSDGIGFGIDKSVIIDELSNDIRVI
ncbi:hypothetical protein V865_000878 [Kwoniella europaea PYCC6329]|uniref:Uncharacterized protein n=1 Tax=Kwoniella europaea PYCC6329 TaxID=1423913 RepID=A0AAX4K8S7_9TREE